MIEDRPEGVFPSSFLVVLMQPLKLREVRPEVVFNGLCHYVPDCKNQESECLYIYSTGNQRHDSIMNRNLFSGLLEFPNRAQTGGFGI